MGSCFSSEVEEDVEDSKKPLISNDENNNNNNSNSNNNNRNNFNKKSDTVSSGEEDDKSKETDSDTLSTNSGTPKKIRTKTGMKKKKAARTSNAEQFAQYKPQKKTIQTAASNTAGAADVLSNPQKQKQKKKEKEKEKGKEKKGTSQVDSTELYLPDINADVSLKQFFEEMSLSVSQVKEFQEIFEFCDKNKDGKISKEELESMVKQMNIKMSKAEFKKLFESLDIDQSGELSFDELIYGLKWLKKGAQIDQLDQLDQLNPDYQDLNHSNLDQINLSKNKQVEVIEKYIGLITKNGIQRSELLLSKGESETAAAIVRSLDAQLLEEVGNALGAQVIPNEDLDKLKKIKKKTKSFTKKE